MASMLSTCTRVATGVGVLTESVVWLSEVRSCKECFMNVRGSPLGFWYRPGKVPDSHNRVLYVCLKEGRYQYNSHVR